jgi:hypothetical protein
MLQREIQRRQQLLDGLTIENSLAERQRHEQEQKRQARLDAQADADRLANIHGPSADLDPQTAATLRANGYRVEDRQTLPARTLDVPTGDSGPMIASRELASTPYSRRAETHTEQLAREQREAAQAERNETRRFRDEQADADRTFRAEQADANRTAAKERADADRDLKMLIAQMTQSGNLETRALGNELKRLQVQAAQDKLDAGRAERERNESGARTSTQTALDLATRLLDPKDVGQHIGAATGSWELRGYLGHQGAQDFDGLRDQLVAALALPNLGQLKGPMSDKDIIFVTNLATRLRNHKLSEPETRKALQEAQMFLRGKLGGGSRYDVTVED